MQAAGVRTLLAGLALALAVLGGWQSAASAPDQDAVSRARAYLQIHSGAYGLRRDLADLRLLDVRSGLSAQHVRYQQTAGGVPVFGGYLTVSLPRGLRTPQQPFVISRYSPRLTVSSAQPVVGLEAALGIVGRSVSLTPDNLRSPTSASLVYYPRGEERAARADLAWQVTAATIEPPGSWLIIVDAATGGVLLRQDLLRSDSGRAFDPNPVTSSGGVIPPPADCDSPANEALLASEYSTKTVRGRLAGQDQLIGEFANLTAPGITGAYKPAGLASEPSHNYVYPCNDDRFEEVMVYHHVDSVQRKIQSLGFLRASGIMDRSIPAHAHYMSTCNAFYDSVTRGIHFGDGTGLSCGTHADAAEDADVIVHEYGHAVQDDQVPGWGFGPLGMVRQTLAMGEGFGDFLPAAMFGDPCLGEWFSIAETACDGSPGLRSLETNAFLSAGTVINLPPWCSSSSDEHCAGLVWSGALWDIVQALGGDQAARDTVLTLVLDSHFYLDPQATFAEGAAAVHQVDSILYGGAHLSVIDSAFSARGISSLGSVSEFPYAYVRILHTYQGDLDVQIKVGPDPGNPLCTINIADPNPGNSSDDIVGFQNLSGDPCAGFLPPSPGTPWLLEVRDTDALVSGTIQQFEIALSGASRCPATDLPVAIPDNDGFVYSAVDCTTVIAPPLDNDGDTVLDVSDPDDDNDGFSDVTEGLTETDPLDACPETQAPNDQPVDSWPPDLNDDRAVNVTDTFQLLPPSFGSTSSMAAYSARKDLSPDGVINVTDLFAVLPPTFGTVCS